MSHLLKIKRVLISVSDKSNLELIAKVLMNLDVEIISSGGTGAYLSQFDIKWTPVETITGNPEAFGGRMKTLSFQISSSLLYRRDHKQDIDQALELGVKPIDMVICNLYPFIESAKRTSDLDILIDNIDIGGPTMVRAAAKNYKDVLVCVAPSDYETLISELKDKNGSVELETRKKQSLKAFKHTALYDTVISEVLGEKFDEDKRQKIFSIDMSTENEGLRYGENPHQWAKVISNSSSEKGLAGIVPIQGKKLSYNNLLDADTAFRCASDLHKKNRDKSIVTIVKHGNPCGVAVSSSSVRALTRAWAGDPVSSFGSIICFNQEVDIECAIFFEISL